MFCVLYPLHIHIQFFFCVSSDVSNISIHYMTFSPILCRGHTYKTTIYFHCYDFRLLQSLCFTILIMLRAVIICTFCFYYSNYAMLKFPFLFQVPIMLLLVLKTSKIILIILQSFHQIVT